MRRLRAFVLVLFLPNAPRLHASRGAFPAMQYQGAEGHQEHAPSHGIRTLLGWTSEVIYPDTTPTVVVSRAPPDGDGGGCGAPILRP